MSRRKRKRLQPKTDKKTGINRIFSILENNYSFWSIEAHPHASPGNDATTYRVTITKESTAVSIGFNLLSTLETCLEQLAAKGKK